MAETEEIPLLALPGESCPVRKESTVRETWGLLSVDASRKGLSVVLVGMVVVVCGDGRLKDCVWKSCG